MTITDDFKTAVTMHSKSGCPFCDEARAFLTARAIPFTELKHDDDQDRQAMYDRLGLVGTQRTVPQIVIREDGEDFRIGGARALRVSGIESLFRRQGLEPLPVAMSVAAKPEDVGPQAFEEPGCCT